MASMVSAEETMSAAQMSRKARLLSRLPWREHHSHPSRGNETSKSSLIMMMVSLSQYVTLVTGDTALAWGKTSGVLSALSECVALPTTYLEHPRSFRERVRYWEEGTGCEFDQQRRKVGLYTRQNTLVPLNPSPVSVPRQSAEHVDKYRWQVLGRTWMVSETL